MGRSTRTLSGRAVRSMAIAFAGAIGLLGGSLSVSPAPVGAVPAPPRQTTVRLTASISPSMVAASGWTVQNTPHALVANGTLSADACAGPRFCVAVGSFSDRFGSSALSEVWNGKAWSLQIVPTPPGGIEGSLQGVSCSSASACLAVGDYLDASGDEVTLAEVWDGTSWSVQSTPDPAGATSSVMESVSCGSTRSCIAVGYFIRTRRIRERLAETWNGTAWTLSKTVNPPDDAGAVLDSVSCATTSFCVAVGYYLDSDTWVTLSEEWNGANWSLLVTSNPAGSIVASLYGVSCSSTTSCTAVGDFVSSADEPLAATLAEAWNGSTWTIEATPNPVGSENIDALQSVACSSTGSCLAVGYFTRLSGLASTTLAEAWNGTKWRIQTTPDSRSNSALYGLSCDQAGTCTAVGYSRNRSGTHLGLIEVTNGDEWRIQSSPVPEAGVSSVLKGVSCTTPTACTAVGSYANSSNTTEPLAEGWNGTDWSVQPTADPSTTRHNVFESVSCSSPNACTAVGQSSSKSSYSTLAERWDGTSWTIEPTPDPMGEGAQLTGVSCASATACTAVGYYITDLGLADTLAETWNGSDWAIQTTPNPSGNDSPILQAVSCSSITACTAVGNYVSNSALVALVERWDGSSWTIESTPAGDDDLYAVSCSSETTCTAVGDSYGYPSGLAPLAEAWNGTTWTVQETPDPISYFSSFYGVSCSSGSKWLRATARGRWS